MSQEAAGAVVRPLEKPKWWMPGSWKVTIRVRFRVLSEDGLKIHWWIGCWVLKKKKRQNISRDRVVLNWDRETVAPPVRLGEGSAAALHPELSISWIIKMVASSLPSSCNPVTVIILPLLLWWQGEGSSRSQRVVAGASLLSFSVSSSSISSSSSRPFSFPPPFHFLLWSEP